MTVLTERKRGGERIPTVVAAFLCAAQIVGGTYVVGAKAWPRQYEAPYWNPADAIVWTGAGAKLFWAHGASKGVSVARDACRPVPPTRIPLAPGGLPQVAHFTDHGGLPFSLSLAMRSTRGKPLAYIRWSWSAVTAWASPSCDTTTPGEGLGPP